MPEQTRGTASSKKVTRRALIGGIAAGTAAISVPGVAAAAAQAGRPRRPPDPRRRGSDGPDGPRDGVVEATARQQPVPAAGPGPAQFSRMFGNHPPFREADDELRVMLAELGRPGGILDAKDPLEVGPIRLITEPELSPDNPDNPTHTAGTTFMGQFFDHDITSDAGSTLGRRTSLRRSTNLRSARFDLDSVYGGGPAASPELYDTAERFKFRIESGGLFEDLPRDANGTAIIADPRNDENMMISGLQAAFLLFHNAVLERVRASDLDGETAFERARQLVIWHYQWLILHEFLPQFVGQAMVNDVLANGRQHYTPAIPRIPVEFQTSAYRFGHSMVRPSYRANLAGDNGEAFFGMVFDPAEFGKSDPADLAGGSRAPRRFIGWQTFFDFEDGEVKPNKTIDTHMSTPMFQLPLGAIGTSRGEPIGPLSLATRNLLRHITWGIPSGQDVAQTMGAPLLSASDLNDISDIAPPLAGATPLWLYILREADLVADGRHLGPVGGRIVAEVFIGLLQLDPTSILNDSENWRPSLPSRGGAGEFATVDLLTIAGVDPVSRGQ